MDDGLRKRVMKVGSDSVPADTSHYDALLRVFPRRGACWDRVDPTEARRRNLPARRAGTGKPLGVSAAAQLGPLRQRPQCVSGRAPGIFVTPRTKPASFQNVQQRSTRRGDS